MSEINKLIERLRARTTEENRRFDEMIASFKQQSDTRDESHAEILKKSRQMPRQLGKWYIEENRQAYESTGNPLFAWDAYQLARSAGFDIPTWVLKYLDQVAAGISNVRPSNEKPIRDQSAAALQLRRNGGGRSDWRRKDKEMLQRFVLEDFRELKDRYPSVSDWKIFAELAAENDLEIDQISKWYYDSLK